MKGVNTKRSVMKALNVGIFVSSLIVSGYIASYASGDKNREGSSFNADLAQVMVVAKQNAKKNDFSKPELDTYVRQEHAKYKKFNKFFRKAMPLHAKILAMGRKDPNKLQAVGERELAKDKESWKGHDYIGTAMLFKQDAKSALKEYIKALDSAPTEMKGWYQYMIGVSALMGRDQNKAMKWMDKAIKDNNNWIAIKGAHLNKAVIYLSKKSFEEAANSLKVYFLMAPPAEKKVVAEGPICQMIVSAGKKLDACMAK